VVIGDTVLHSWEVLASILSSDQTLDILCDIGMCVHFSFLLYEYERLRIHPRPRPRAGQ